MFIILECKSDSSGSYIDYFLLENGFYLKNVFKIVS